jgi:hypothetical protein
VYYSVEMPRRSPRFCGAEANGERKNTRESIVADEATQMQEKIPADEATD